MAQLGVPKILPRIRVEVKVCVFGVAYISGDLFIIAVAKHKIETKKAAQTWHNMWWCVTEQKLGEMVDTQTKIAIPSR